MNETARSLRRSTFIALWWTLHAYLATLLLQFALGDFSGKALGVGQYIPAEIAEVARYLNIPLPTLVAFPLFFLAIAAGMHVWNILIHRVLHRLDATDLALVSSESIKWTARQLLRPGWLLVTLGTTALFVLIVFEGRNLKIALIAVTSPPYPDTFKLELGGFRLVDPTSF
jgi:hypothetical protein